MKAWQEKTDASVVLLGRGGGGVPLEVESPPSSRACPTLYPAERAERELLVQHGLSRTTTMTKEVPRALLSFTPPPPLSTAKPYYELEKHYYVDVDAKAFFPRVMSFGWTLRRQEEQHHTHVVQVFPAKFTDNTQYYGLADSDDERLSQMEMRQPYANEECVPMQDWQVTYHPSCNTMHETALESMGLHAEDDAHLFGTKGYWRNAWTFEIE